MKPYGIPREEVPDLEFVKDHGKIKTTGKRVLGRKRARRAVREWLQNEEWEEDDNGWEIETE